MTHENTLAPVTPARRFSMHYKRRRRRRAGIKGCCGLCMLRTTTGKRTTRKLTRPELYALQSAREQLAELGLSAPPLPGRSRYPGA